MPDPRSLKLGPLVLGGTLFLVCTIAAIVLGNYALGGDGPRPFDQSMVETMKEMGDARPMKGKVMVVVTTLGDYLFLASVALLGAVWQAVRRQWWLAAAWVTIALGGLVLNEGVKNWVHRERPAPRWYDPAVVRAPRSYSFPSGHALGSTIIYGLLGYTMLLGAKRRLYVILVLAEVMLIVGAVGFSRIYLRVHWASDVLAGFLIGTAWLALTLGLLESWRRRVPPPEGAMSQGTTE